MSTYLFLWNPTKPDSWNDYNESIKEFKNKGQLTVKWYVGTNYKNIKAKDRVFFVKTGGNNQGVFASGYAASGARICKDNKSKHCIEIRIDALIEVKLDQDDGNNARLLSCAYLQGKYPLYHHWTPQASGTRINKYAVALEREWEFYCKKKKIKTHSNVYKKLAKEREYFEGGAKSIILTRYERNDAVRQVCLDYHGYSCKVCGFNFEKVYGEIGKEFIHVHHKNPISNNKKKKRITPISDLIPVCPNCHAMLHQEKPPLTIQKLKSILKK